MSFYPKIILNSGKDHSLKRFHPWVFSGAIKNSEEINEGDVVEVYSSKNEYLATGHYQKGSIAVRIISFEQIEINHEFWVNKVKKAYDFRTVVNLTNNLQTNVYRLIFAEGDNLPGLIIDYYNGTAVLQAHSIGMFKARHEITKALIEVLGDKLKAVYDKSAETLPDKAALEAKNDYLYGSTSIGVVNEYDNKFKIDWESGQKTGFFIDQRENRLLLAKYVKDKAVLNTFCYTGGFSVYALNAGAKLVHSVDSSKKAMELTDINIELNEKSHAHQSFTTDVFSFLKDIDNKYDVIVLDPPAFAKSRNVTHNAVQGYKRINAEAIRKIKKGGILFTFSCSQVIQRSLFVNTVIAAAIEAGRKAKIIHHLSQPADHPVNIFHPEGEYLKGLVLYIE
ncbi:MAG: class I SAM-dependent rRNA methyltransferase [Bacteroidota bacterium]|nr:class I SAM-dependent rRNA methyltransferase [Bacteroidota bacterium]